MIAPTAFARPAIAVAALAGVGTLGWVAFRYYVRSEVVRTLNEEHNYDEIVKQTQVLRGIGLDLRLPSAEEFAVGLVPIWSTVMPEDTIDDVLLNGRKSPYWPEAYRTGSAAAAIEPYLLAGLRKSKGATTPQQGTTALLSGITEALVRATYKT